MWQSYRTVYRIRVLEINLLVALRKVRFSPHLEIILLWLYLSALKRFCVCVVYVSACKHASYL